MATTLAQIKDEFYSIVNQNATGNTVYTESFVENLANVVQKEICRSWKWPFLKKKSLYAAVPDVKLSAAVATTDTTVSLTSVTNFATSGAILTEFDVINYTGISTLDLTGVTNIDIAHASGKKVEYLFSVPSDFGQRPTLTTTGSSLPYSFIEETTYEENQTSRKWTIVHDKSANEFIRVDTDNLSSTNIFSFQYYKTPATMTDSVDATIPDDFALEVIPRTMAGVAMIIRDDDVDNLGSVISNIARQNIIQMKKYYGSRTMGEVSKFSSVYHSTRPTARI